MKREILCLMAAVCLLTGCAVFGDNQKDGRSSANEEASASGELFAMDTYMTVTCYGEQCEEALAAALAEIERLDALLSTGSADSEVSRLNAAGSLELSEDTAVLVEEALALYETTDGAFDITVYPLMELWGFTTGAFAVPDAQLLTSTLALCDSSRLIYEEQTKTLTLGEGQAIDLGGIAKGYTSDLIMDIMEEYDLVSGMVWLGGNVQCYGSKTDGSDWRVGIQNPLEPDDTSSFLGILSVSGKAVITSGAYERYFEEDETGEVYHHILDPATGYPAQSGLCSVTIVSEDGMLADGLSTACYVMGLEDAIAYWQTYGAAFDMILMTDDGEVWVTEPIADDFTSEFHVTVIVKGEA